MRNLKIDIKKNGTSLESFKVNAKSDKAIFSGTKEIVVENNAERIYDDTLGETNIEFYSLAQKITQLGDNVKHENNNVRAIIVGKNIKVINSNAFNKYTKLSSVELNEGLMAIGENAFADCPILGRVVCKSNTPPTLGTNSFTGVSSEFKVLVNHEAKNAYKSAWATLAEKIEDYGDIVLGENEKKVTSTAQTFVIPFETIGYVTGLTITPIIGNVGESTTEATYGGVTKTYNVYKTTLDDTLIGNGTYNLYYEDGNGNKLGNFEELYTITNNNSVSWITWLVDMENKVIKFTVIENREEERQVTFSISPNTDIFIKKKLLIKQKIKETTTRFLTFSAEGYQELAIKRGSNPNIEYSYDKENWLTQTSEILPFGSSYGELYIRGNNPNGFSNSGGKTRFTFTTDSEVTCAGNIMHLLSYEEDLDTIPNANCFSNLFAKDANINTEKNVLVKGPEMPAINLNDSCYSNMFQYQTKLAECCSVLPATIAKKHCYSSMFWDCRSLMTTPEIKLTTLDDSCCALMFLGCNTLVDGPELYASELKLDCYYEMFYECSALKEFKVHFNGTDNTSPLYNWLYGTQGSRRLHVPIGASSDAGKYNANGWAIINDI